MNFVFGFMVIISIFVAAFTGKINIITVEAVTSAREGVTRIFGLIGIITFWLGIAKIAERSGLLSIFTKLLQPLIGWLFPSIPKGHPAMGSILMNLSANMFGFGSAATPFGLKAMEELQMLNHSERASDAMCTFLAINISNVSLIPSSIIALRINSGSVNPLEIVGTTLIASIFSTLIAIIADGVLRSYSKIRGR